MEEVAKITHSINRPTVDVYVVSCGGDGTVIWVIQELTEVKPNYNRLTMVMIPFGTGNDFSIATGFQRIL